jgi:N-acetylmuramic acid 6-phosphate etherase
MTTERRSPRSVDIDLLPTNHILKIINAEDATVAAAVKAAIPEIAATVEMAVQSIRSGGRIIYVGAGTSGRIGMLDAAECPPTFSTPPDWVLAVLAGGPMAFFKANEALEDDRSKAIADLKAKRLTSADLVIGIAASGKTPYTLSAIEYANSRHAKTVALVSTPDTPLAKLANITILTIVGPEVITGSSRMKTGTAQKMVLNMISTATMIRLGMTYSNWMINVSMTNQKLRRRGVQILREILGINAEEAAGLVKKSGRNLKVAVIMGTLGCTRSEAQARLTAANGSLRDVLGRLGTDRE